MAVFDDGGDLERDLGLLNRSGTDRRTFLLGLIAGAAAVACADAGTLGTDDGTGSDDTSGDDDDDTTDGTTSDDAFPAETDGVIDGECVEIPEETAGPYPGDGSNGPNALSLDDIVRSDIRQSVGDASGIAEGVPLRLRFRLVDQSGGCTPLSGRAIYAWHCDADGDYSMYSAAVADENFLRGVQETDEDGVVEFVTIFPGCYAGRWPHVHFEVYPSLAQATRAANKVATSQLAFPKAPCAAVYAEDGYSNSAQNLDQISLGSDNVFSDGVDQQLATVSGSVEDGFVAELLVAI